MERWETLKEYDNYEVSTLGNIRRKLNGKPLKKMVNRNGYHSVCLHVLRNGMYIPKVFLLHRLIAKTFLPIDPTRTTVDHINRDKLCNEATNLRWANAAEQAFNRSKIRGKSGYIGVRKVDYFLNDGSVTTRWVAKICVDYKPITIGSYGTAIEAANAYDAKAIEIRGQFAVLNTPITA